MGLLKMVNIVVESQHEFLNGLRNRSGVELEDAEARRILGSERVLAFLDGEWGVFSHFVSPGFFGIPSEELACPSLGAFGLLVGRSPGCRGGIVAGVGPVFGRCRPGGRSKSGMCVWSGALGKCRGVFLPDNGILVEMERDGIRFVSIAMDSSRVVMADAVLCRAIGKGGVT